MSKNSLENNEDMYKMQTNEELQMDHHYQHYYQIVNLTKKDFSNVKELIAVDLYMSEQKLIQIRTILL